MMYFSPATQFEEIQNLKMQLEQLKAELAKKHDACPNCGYCPHCGRSAWPAYPVLPLTPSYPYWPYYTTATWSSKDFTFTSTG